MRIRATTAVIVLAGIVVGAGLLVDNRPLSPVELENVRSVCPECHGEVPEYTFAIKVHDKHAAFECGFCHRDIDSLKTADRAHKIFQGLCIGMLSLSLMGVLINLFSSKKNNGAS